MSNNFRNVLPKKTAYQPSQSILNHNTRVTRNWRYQYLTLLQILFYTFLSYPFLYSFQAIKVQTVKALIVFLLQ